MKKEKFAVKGMTCAVCQNTVDKTVRKLQGVEAVEVNLLTHSMKVSYDSKQLSHQEIIKAVDEAGYQASLFKDSLAKLNTKEKEEMNEQKKIRLYQKKLIISLGILILLMYVAMGDMLHLPMIDWLNKKNHILTNSLVQLFLTLPILILYRKFFENGFKALKNKMPNMDSLVAIGSGAAFVYGVIALFRMSMALELKNHDLLHSYHHNLYFESAAMIVTIIALGKYLESNSKRKTTKAIEKLVELSPKEAEILKEGSYQLVDISEVKVGDIYRIKPGQMVSLDGEVIEGTSLVDESSLTGESLPVSKKAGDQIYGGTINQNGMLIGKATKVGEETLLAQITTLVEEAASSKAPISRMADKVSGVFVPIVISLAMLTTLFWLVIGSGIEWAIGMGISVLVISCPCALGLATPVAIMVAVGKGASDGILIKSAQALELLGKIDTIVFDKTGTLTKGEPKVTDIVTLGDVEEREFLRMAASLELASLHPLGKAIVQKAKELDVSLLQIEEVKEIPGKGMVGYIEDIAYGIGNQAFMLENEISMKDELGKSFLEEGKTLIFLAKEDTLLGYMAIADVIKEESIEVIEKLKAMKITPIMLTGDHEKTARRIGKSLHIDEIIAGVLPDEKEACIRRLKNEGKQVVMVGDGINDAPALMRADVGIAIGTGTDIAIEAADIVLMSGHLGKVIDALALSQATIRNIYQNLFWAFFYNVLGIPLAMGLFYPLWGVKLNPMIASIAMSLSSIFVVTNALRLRRFKGRYSRKDVSVEI